MLLTINDLIIPKKTFGFFFLIFRILNMKFSRKDNFREIIFLCNKTKKKNKLDKRFFQFFFQFFKKYHFIVLRVNRQLQSCSVGIGLFKRLNLFTSTIIHQTLLVIISQQTQNLYNNLYRQICCTSMYFFFLFFNLKPNKAFTVALTISY